MEQEFDYDIFIIGGGSGGLSCSQACKKYGVKVALADFVKPSPHGSKWGIGGTCVNVGCIPKKLMHFASIIGELRHDQQAAGWNMTGQNHDWNTMVQKLVDAKGVQTTVTAKYIVIAVGGRPLIPPELDSVRQYILTSDDIFMKKTPPGKTLVIGASYVALECAGFLVGLGYETTIMVRSILLRGFDQDMANRIGKYMHQNGCNFLMQKIPVSAQKLENGQIQVFFQDPEKTQPIQSDIYDTVLVATGRYPDTQKLGCDLLQMKLDKNGKIIVQNDESTSIPNIFAIGDVASGKLELTPPAIMAGKLLADRLFNNSQQLMNYKQIATTVFTPIEYGAIGYSEEDAIAIFGEQISVYHSTFKPLEWNYNDENLKDSCYAKLIVNKQDNNRVIGLHYLGPNAGEVTQGYAVAIKLGATKQDFDNTVGIHPTCSEEILTLKVTKEEDPDANKEGC